MQGGRRLRGLRADEVLRAMERAGWYRSASSSGHVQLRHPDVAGKKVTVPRHGGRALDIKVVRSILQQAGPTPEEFERLL